MKIRSCGVCLFLVLAGHSLLCAQTYTFTTFAGSSAGDASVDGTGTTARFGHPQGIVVDQSGNAYVIDNTTHTIRKVTPAGLVSTFAGLAGNSGYVNGTGSAARSNDLRAIAIDGSGALFVNDHGNRCRLGGWLEYIRRQQR